MSVTTDASHTIGYKEWTNIVYVTNPVNQQYESMNVIEPTSVDGTSVDAAGAPILFSIGVGGYMSSSVWVSGSGGAPGGADANSSYALAAGYVVVQVGCRGRDNGSSGNYYGVAPAAIEDLKAAVRYIRHNSGSIPGNVNWIVTSGGSAGGALSALVGASGVTSTNNNTLYEAYLTTLGAASAADNIFAVGAWSPITNLDHADMAYEMEYGSLKSGGSPVNQTASSQLIGLFDAYQDSLGLTDKRGSYGILDHSNITDYILTQYMEPSLNKYVQNGGSAPSYATCSGSGSSKTCTFTFSDYVNNSIGTRGKGEPAFDAFFDVTSSSSYYGTNVNTSCPAEVLEFGLSSGTASSYSGSNCSGGSPRHFTDFSSQAMSGTNISSSMQTTVDMMNPMYFIMNAESGMNDSSGVAPYWYIRDGSIATDTSAYIILDLATSLDDVVGASHVNAWEDWSEGHNVETDPAGFHAWVKQITGYGS